MSNYFVKRSRKIFLPLLLGSVVFWIAGCSTAPGATYERVRVKTIYASGDRTVNNTESWSVITDPVVLDDAGPAPIIDASRYDEEWDFARTTPAPALIDEPPVHVREYYYDSYYPVSYTTYWYYPRYRTTWWYYDDFYNNPYYYPSYAYYGGYYNSWGYPYTSAIIVDDDCSGLAYYYSGYSPYGFWSPLDYYNPYWTYGWNDYWGRYYPSPYYAYDPFYDPWDYYYWPHRRHFWAYDDDWDRGHNDRDSDREKRAPQPMIGDRREQIRLTSSDPGGISGVRLSDSQSERSARLPAKSEQRELYTRQFLPRQEEPRADGWSLSPLRSQKPTDTSNPYYTRDEKNGRTVRTFREPKTADNAYSSPAATQESPRTANSNGWTSTNPYSRVSTWRRNREITSGGSGYSPDNGTRNLSPDQTQNRQIRVLPAQSNRRSEPAPLYSEPTANTYSAQTRAGQYKSTIRTLTPSSPVRQAPGVEAPRPFLNPSRDSYNTSASESRAVSPMRSSPRTESNSMSSGRSFNSPARESSPRTFTPHVQSERSSSDYSPSRSSFSSPSSEIDRGHSSSEFSAPRSMSAPSSSFSPRESGGGMSMSPARSESHGGGNASSPPRATSGRR